MLSLPEADLYEPLPEIFRSVTMVGYQKQNWAKHSGANSILNLVPIQNFLLRKPVPGVIYRLWRPFRSFFQRRNAWYEINSGLLEFKVALDWIRKKNHIYHFLSGETEYLFSGRLKRIAKSQSNRIVCTFHSPEAEYLRTVHHNRAIKDLDAAVVVASNMVDFFSSMLGQEKVWQIPHGVDTTFWRAGEKSRNFDSEFRVLIVGSHFRDFEILRQVIQNLSAQKGIYFDAVLSKQDAAELGAVSRLNLHSNIGDEQLLNLYQRANALLCPLIDCTASNTLLEAMACGTPVVCTDVGGVRDYVNRECAILTQPNDSAQMTDVVLSLRVDIARQLQMSASARKRALELDWRVIALKLAEVYRHLLHG